MWIILCLTFIACVHSTVLSWSAGFLEDFPNLCYLQHVPVCPQREKNPSACSIAFRIKFKLHSRTKTTSAAPSPAMVLHCAQPCWLWWKVGVWDAPGFLHSAVPVPCSPLCLLRTGPGTMMGLSLSWPLYIRPHLSRMRREILLLALKNGLQELPYCGEGHMAGVGRGPLAA